MSKSSRGPRAFTPGSFGLEGRLLLANARPSVMTANTVQFQGAPAEGSAPQFQVVGQQDGSATVLISRTRPRGTLAVRVTTDPTSPAIGVNVGAVDQTITFPKGQRNVAVTVPILAGAPNPGEVDVNLEVTPLSPGVQSRGPLQLRVLANTSTPPRVVSVQGKSEGIVVGFNKSMDPVSTTNLNNYKVSQRVDHEDNGFDPFSIFKAWGPTGSSTTTKVEIQSAQYDPANNTVTLIPTRRLNYKAAEYSVFAQHPEWDTGSPISDLQGNPVLVAPEAAPGYFSYMVDVNLKPPEVYHI